MKKEIITETLRKLSYKNISIDTTKGRDTIADELLKSLKEKLMLTFIISPIPNEVATNTDTIRNVALIAIFRHHTNRSFY